MVPYVVSVSETRTRAFRVAAADPQAAETAVRLVLRQGQRIVGVATERAPGVAYGGAGQDALAHLLSRDWLPQGADPQALTVEEWLRLGLRHPGASDVINPRIAPAGLRLRPASLAAPRAALVVASANSIPQLAAWFRRTPWAGGGLVAALLDLPDATRGAYTFAGINARAAVIPLDQALPALCDRGAA